MDIAPAGGGGQRQTTPTGHPLRLCSRPCGRRVRCEQPVTALALDPTSATLAVGEGSGRLALYRWDPLQPGVAGGRADPPDVAAVTVFRDEDPPKLLEFCECMFFGWF